MKIIQRLFAVLLCIVIGFSLCPSVLAENNTAKINVSSVDAMPGDVVSINISIDNNPGIMAMAFCVTYDNTALEYVQHEAGIFSSFTYKDHIDKGHISFVNVGNKDNTSNGCFLSVSFKVKENAKPGKHVIALANSNRDKYGTKLHNSFSNSKQDFVVPAVTSGSINVAETCENAGHNYGDWEIVRESNCTDDGLKRHVCSRCNIIEEVIISAAHDFETEWTIDKAATPEEDGIMSRHCTACDAKTDEFTFSYEEIGGEETPDDTSSDNSSSQESEPESSETESNSSATSSDDIITDKPNIDNVVGEKVPQQEAEKFEEYQPPKQEENTSSENTSSEVASNETSSLESTPSSSDTTLGSSDSNTIKQEKKPSFFATPKGIIMVIAGSLLSIGIIALGVIMIMRKQKEQ